MHAFVYAKSCQNGKINECDFIIHVMMYKKNENVRLLDATVFGMLYWYMYMYMDRTMCT
jgi:hypothetical protein